MIKIPRFYAGNLKPYWRRREWLTRSAHLGLLLLLPFWLPVVFLWRVACDLWDERRDFVGLVKDLAEVALLPWSNKGPQPGEEEDWPQV